MATQLIGVRKAVKISRRLWGSPHWESLKCCWVEGEVCEEGHQVVFVQLGHIPPVVGIIVGWVVCLS